MASIAGITLPVDIVWMNEDIETPISHGLEYSSGGALQISRHKKIAGIKMKINCHWLLLSVVNELKSLRDTDSVMDLILASGEPFRVMFDQNNSPVETAQPLGKTYSVRDGSEKMKTILNLITV